MVPRGFRVFRINPPFPWMTGQSEPGKPSWDASDGNVLNCTWERFYLKKKSGTCPRNTLGSAIIKDQDKGKPRQWVP